MKWFCTVYFILGCCQYSKCANILCLFPHPGRSHYVMFESILKALAEKGHNLDVVSHFPQKEPIIRYNDISLEGTQRVFTEGVAVEEFMLPSPYHSLSLVTGGLGVTQCEATLNSDAVKQIRKPTREYDLLITELYATDCMLGFGYYFKIPVVVMTSSMMLPWGNDRFGNPDNPGYIPTYLTDYSPRMTLLERTTNTWWLLMSKLFFYFLSERPSNVAAKKYFGPDLPDLRELAYNTSLVLVNSHFSMNQARPTVPNFIEVGGVHITKPRPLNEHFQQLLKTERKGIIILTMGSMILTETFPVESIQGLFDAFAELNYKVIWKADQKRFPKGLRFPKNIHFEKWLPQLDILCHGDVKLFVSHGGLMGSQEAVYCGVPRLGIPLFADQDLNIRQSERMGLAIRVAYNNISKDSILEAATELLNNPKYTETAKVASNMFRDRPTSPIDTALYWIEYVIRHNGAPQLRSVGAELYWYQYHLLDVISVFILAPFALLVTTFSLVKFLKKFAIIKYKLD